MKLLIAEDDFTSQAVLRAVLEKWGYEVVSTSSGDESWAVFQTEGAPQLAILDWEMPGMDGVELCRRLRAQKRADPLYLIILTAKVDREDIIRGLEAGADDYIAKPYDNAELRARTAVGERIVALQNKLRQRDKLQGVLEMAGAVCHELNQPLQSVFGFSELLMMDLDPDDPRYPTLRKIKDGVERIGELTRKIMQISKYRTKGYLDGRGRIVDIHEAAVLDGNCKKRKGWV